MVVSVNFHTPQRRLTRTDRIDVPIVAGDRVTDVLRYLKECYPDLTLTEDTVLVTVNDRISSLDQTLKARDRISFVPHIGGG